MNSEKEKSSRDEKKSLGQTVGDSISEVGRTFVHLLKAPRALWGINISYLFEGLAYFGVLTILGKYLSEDVGLADLHAGWVYSIFTGGITFAMLILGGVSDKIGVRRALLLALGMMVIGRTLLGASGTFFEYGQGAGSPMFFTVLAGLFCVVIGYGMYQPAAYAGVKAFTNKKTAAIGYAMIYALMNLGAFFSGIISPPVRQATSMTGVYWVFVVITILAFLSVLFILTRRIVIKAEKKVKQDNEEFEAEEGDGKEQQEGQEKDKSLPNDDRLKDKPQRSLLEPVTVILFVLVLGGAGGFLYRMIESPVSNSEAALSTHGDAVLAAWGKLVEAQDNGAGSSAAVEAYHSTVENERVLSAIGVPGDEVLNDDDVITSEIDRGAFGLAAEKVRVDGELVGRFAKVDGVAAAPEFSEEHTRAVRDVLRDHAVTTMAAAYGLVRVGEVDRSVVDMLRLRMKEIDEEIIPMSDEEIERITAIAARKPGQMLRALADSVDVRIAAIEELLSPEERVELIASLKADRDFAASMSGKLEGDLNAVSRDLLLEKLVSDSTAALDQARLLIAAVRELGFMDRMVEALTEWLMGLVGTEQEDTTPPSFASVKLGSTAACSAEMGKLLPGAVPLKTGARFTSWISGYGMFIIPALVFLLALVFRLLKLRPDHPFNDRRFTFFIFILVPVQTLFAHNWLTLPYYINRAFGGTAVGDNFEFFSNLNPILIFVFTPLIAALTSNSKPYRMMMIGTLVMAVPTFLLALPASPTLLLAYILLMTIGEAMWQPRFLQVIAEIAPEGKTGAYMGIGQLPWFLTKLVTGMYSGYFIANYCPRVGPQNPELMWLIYAFIAIISPIGLILARGWMGSYLEKKHT